LNNPIVGIVFLRVYCDTFFPKVTASTGQSEQFTGKPSASDRGRLFSCAKIFLVRQFAHFVRDLRQLSEMFRLSLSAYTRPFRHVSFAKAVLATTLVLSVLAGGVVNALSAAQACPMPCCAGKAMSLADSSGGSCHAHLSVRKQSRPEHLCGARIPSTMHAGDSHFPYAVQAEVGPSYRGTNQANEDGQAAAPASPLQEHSVKRLALTRPCALECGAGANGSGQLRRSRDLASSSHAGQLRPTTKVGLATDSEKPLRSVSALRDQSRPRAPPTPLS